MNLVLIGFMGVGKTSVGRRLAERLNRPFIDTDAIIEEAFSMPVAAIFANHGEASFRAKERNVVQRVARRRGAVIATGGGVVLDRGNVLRLKRHGLLIHLTLSPETIFDRIGDVDQRPLLATENPRQTLELLFRSRERIYRACCDLTVDRTGQPVEETVDQILASVFPSGRNASPESLER